MIFGKRNGFGGENMATSTFGKSFSVSKKNASDFTSEMIKKAAPTLSYNFKSSFAPLANDTKLKNQLLNVLGK